MARQVSSQPRTAFLNGSFDCWDIDPVNAYLVQHKISQQMTKREIQVLLQEKHNNLTYWLEQQTDEQWIFAPPNKWTTGQHVLHLIQSIKPLNRALGYPRFLVRYRFGKCNRPTRKYTQVVKRYQQKLRAAGKIVSPYSRDMQVPPAHDKQAILLALQREVEGLKQRLEGWPDRSLDRLLLPHPLMGKMTVREIIMWTGYHAEHHYLILEDKYSL